MVAMAGGVSVIIHTKEENEFKMSAEEFKSAITPNTKAFLINSPSNPTGMIYTAQELKEFADICVENDIYVISDEIYEKLIYDGRTHTSIASFNDKIKELTIVINGVSKSNAMTGWRIGYSASNKEIANIMANYQSHATSNPNTIAQYAAKTAIAGDDVETEKMRVEFGKRRDYMVEHMNKIPRISCILPHGAFYVMMNIKELIGETMYGHKITDADDFCTLLLEKTGVALVPCTSFEAPEFVRWSYATSLENIKEGLKRVEKFITE